jgi:hypothetical protein
MSLTFGREVLVLRFLKNQRREMNGRLQGTKKPLRSVINICQIAKLCFVFSPFCVYPILFACHFTDDFFCPGEMCLKKTNLWPFRAFLLRPETTKKKHKKVVEENERVFNSKFPFYFPFYPSAYTESCLQVLRLGLMANNNVK